MRKILMQYLFLVIFLLVPVASDSFAESDSAELAQSILQKADQIRFPRESFQVDVSINTTAPDQPEEARDYRVLSKGNENSVVMTTAPASERGQILLMKGRDLWIFMPEVSQPIRLSLS
ncbi:MAG TPA: outer membrane lipoprotein-sorting protein, partial [Nitrosospira sp.]|nr:outer membrane lipoprotein-sorting protein [Nitrosospira sp.]